MYDTKPWKLGVCHVPFKQISPTKLVSLNIIKIINQVPPINRFLKTRVFLKWADA